MESFICQENLKEKTKIYNRYVKNKYVPAYKQLLNEKNGWNEQQHWEGVKSIIIQMEVKRYLIPCWVQKHIGQF